jgi:hypothetical protein
MDIVYNCARNLVKKKFYKEEYHHSINLCRTLLNVIPHALVREFETINYPFQELNDQQLYKSTIKALSFMIKIPVLYHEAAAFRDEIVYKFCFPLFQTKLHNFDKITPEDYKGMK